MKTTKTYSPKVSIETEKLEALLKLCTNAINHSLQTETFIRHNPQVHASELRKALSSITTELKEQTKQWVCPYSRVQDLTEDIIDEYVTEADKQFDYEPSDEEISDSYGYTAKEISDRAWQQKVEAKG